MLEVSVLVPIGEGCVAWGMGRLGRGRFLAELAWGALAEPELETKRWTGAEDRRRNRNGN